MSSRNDYNKILTFCKDPKANIESLSKVSPKAIDWLRPYAIKAYEKDRGKNPSISMLYALCTKTLPGTPISDIVSTLSSTGWDPERIFYLLDSINQLVGVNSVISVVRIRNKLIMLFDGRYEKTGGGGCINNQYSFGMLNNFLQALFWNSPVCCDFYIESPYVEFIHRPGIRKSEIENLGFSNIVFYNPHGIDKTAEQYFQCLLPHKKFECLKRGNLRAHNIETKGMEFMDHFEYIRKLDIQKWYNNFTGNKLTLTEKELTDILKKMTDESINVASKFMDNKLEEGYSLINKFYMQGGIPLYDPKNLPYLLKNGQITKIPKYYGNNRVLKDSALHSFVRFDEPRIVAIISKTIQGSMKRLTEFLLKYFLSTLMDAYAIGRMHKMMNDNPESSGIWVILAGNEHTVTFKRFFERMYNVTIQHNVYQEDSNCAYIDPDIKKYIIGNLRDIFNKPNTCTYKMVNYPE